MTSKEFEKQLGEAIRSGKVGIGDFIPISELGMSSEGYMINVDELNEGLYESYVAMCHSNDADDQSAAHEAVTKDYLNGDFAVYGQRGMFKWFTLAAKYPTEIHKMNTEKIEHNKFYSELQNGGGYSLGQRLATVINRNDFFTRQLRSHVVVNPTVFISGYDPSYEDICMMSSFLEKFVSQDERDLVYKDGENLRVKKEKIKGKDVIIPFAYITESTLNFFPRVAKDIFIKHCGANTVTAVGLVRFVPSIDGKLGDIKNDLLSQISPNPFFEIPRLF